jgi:hypothetical protein
MNAAWSRDALDPIEVRAGLVGTERLAS